jgi:hypothetical protein
VTTDRDIAPVIRSWLHGEPDDPTGHVLDRALAVVDLTPQRSATRWPARRPDMNTIIRFGIAAAVVSVAVALGFGIFQNVGNLMPAPDASDDASPASGRVPAELSHIFIGATRNVTGIEVDDRLVIDLTAQTFSLHTGIDQSALVSAASMAESGSLRLETVVGTTECADGDVGTYRYSLSPGGSVLTITSGDDPWLRGSTPSSVSGAAVIAGTQAIGASASSRPAHRPRCSSTRTSSTSGRRSPATER